MPDVQSGSDGSGTSAQELRTNIISVSQTRKLRPKVVFLGLSHVFHLATWGCPSCFTPQSQSHHPPPAQIRVLRSHLLEPYFLCCHSFLPEFLRFFFFLIFKSLLTKILCPQVVFFQPLLLTTAGLFLQNTNLVMSFFSLNPSMTCLCFQDRV